MDCDWSSHSVKCESHTVYGKRLSAFFPDDYLKHFILQVLTSPHQQCQEGKLNFRDFSETIAQPAQLSPCSYSHLLIPDCICKHICNHLYLYPYQMVTNVLFHSHFCMISKGLSAMTLLSNQPQTHVLFLYNLTIIEDH